MKKPLSDEDRIARATRSGKRMLGPLERERCPVHKRRWTIFRWVWDVPGEGEDPIDVISGAEPETIRACQQCDEEAESENYR